MGLGLELGLRDSVRVKVQGFGFGPRFIEQSLQPPVRVNVNALAPRVQGLGLGVRVGVRVRVRVKG